MNQADVQVNFDHVTLFGSLVVPKPRGLSGITWEHYWNDFKDIIEGTNHYSAATMSALEVAAYDEGHADGREASQEEVYDEGLENGREEGEHTGHVRGYEEGHIAGCIEGHAAGLKAAADARSQENNS